MPAVAPSPLSPTLTVTVRACANVSPSVEAVTVTVGAVATSSVTVDGLADRVISVVSSSVSVMLVPFTVRPVEVAATVMLSSPSTTVSPVGVRLKVAAPADCPAVIVMSKLATAA